MIEYFFLLACSRFKFTSVIENCQKKPLQCLRSTDRGHILSMINKKHDNESQNGKVFLDVRGSPQTEDIFLFQERLGSQ